MKTAAPKLTSVDVGARARTLLTGSRPGDKLTKEERVERGRANIQFFNRYYLADYFSAEPAGFHAELAEIAFTQRRAAMAAPREHAKSTLVSFSIPLHAICYATRRFIVQFRETDPIAQQAIDEIRQELESNERLHEDFGDLVGRRKWAEGEFVTANGVKVLGRGQGSSARGLRYKQFRPDLVVVDDIENDEQVTSRQQRDKLERWFKRVVSNIVGPDGALLVIGTILHHDSLLSRLLKQTDVYVTRLWRAIKEDGKPLWPARWPIERLDAKRKEIGARDFATEFMNDAANEEDQIFDPGKWKYFRDEDLKGLKMTVVGAIDPAIGQKARNDDTAAAIVAEADGRYYVLRVVIKKLKFQAQGELVVSLCREWPVVKFGVETIAYQEALKQHIEDLSARDGLQIPCVAVEDRSSDKITRISRLAPLFEQERILFPSASSSHWSPDVRKCIDQFEALGCSTNAHDDGPDAVERALALLIGKSRKKGTVKLW